MRGHSEGCSGGMKKQKFLSWHSVNEESLRSLWPGQVRLGRGLQPPRSPTLSCGDGAPERFAGRTHPQHTLQPLQASPARTRACTRSMPTPLHTHMCLQPTRACALHTGAHPAHACAHWRALLTHMCKHISLVPGADDLGGLFQHGCLCDPVTHTVCQTNAAVPRADARALPAPPAHAALTNS